MENPCHPAQPTSFEAALARLEDIVHRLEDGDVGLAEALEHYEQAVGYLRQCYQLVERAERKIELLCGVDAEGRAEVEIFADPGNEEGELTSKAAQRSQRRSRTMRPRRDDLTPPEDEILDSSGATRDGAAPRNHVDGGPLLF